MAAFACRSLLTSTIFDTMSPCEQAAGHPQHQKLQQVGVDGQVSERERERARICVYAFDMSAVFGTVFSQLIRRYDENMFTHFNILRWSLRQLEVELKGLRTFDAPKTGEGPESN